MEVLLEKKFKKLNFTEQTAQVKKLLAKNDVVTVIDSLVKCNLDINDCLLIFQEFKDSTNSLKLKDIELISLIINAFTINNKKKKLQKYLQKIDKEKLEIILNYEIENETKFSKTKTYKKLKNPKRKAKQFLIFSIIFLIFLVIITFVVLDKFYKLALYYQEHVYPNIYLDEKLITGEEFTSLANYLKSEENKLDAQVKFINANDEYTYTYREIGLKSNIAEIQEEVITNYKDYNEFQTLKSLFQRETKKYQITYQIDEAKYQEFLNTLKSKVNVAKTQEKFSISGGKIHYQKGMNGFTLDTKDLDKEILNSLTSNTSTITLKGNIDKTNNYFSMINKKVASFTTYYDESQGRATNIRNASRKLNGTIVYPGDTFSYYRTVGPYSSKGYVVYHSIVGSGVCQLSTTIYNVQLRLNLPIVSRYNHGEMVPYVDYGMDATVYGSSVDYRFKNNTKYPIYIESSASGGALTVSFWSNANIIPEGYSYKPRAEKIGTLAYKTYLDTYYNGKVIKSTYLNSSYYTKGK